jgi:FkbM family methyltransferase
MYSQSNEESVICHFFSQNGIVPSILSIGENDGTSLSNCRKLIEMGASAVLVEPSVKAFKKLHKLYYGDPHRVWAFNVAIGNKSGEADFYESGEHLGKGDVALLSTLKETEMKKWGGTKNAFEKTKVLVWTMDELKRNVIDQGRLWQFDFINIDAEGYDLDILKQIDLKAVRCACLCIEHNSNKDVEREIREYCASFGLTKELGKNAENIILAKP